MFWRVTLATEGRFAFDPLRRLVAVVVRVCPGLLLFAVVDDHVHAVLAGERRVVGAIASGLSRALAAVVSVPLQPPARRDRRSAAWRRGPRPVGSQGAVPGRRAGPLSA